MILIDSDVLIWDTRGHAQAKARLAAIDPWRISAVTYMELAQGCRDSAEIQRLKRGLDLQDTEILPITAEISRRAMALIDTHALTAGLRLADALIAATALEHRLTLLTGNTRHFTSIDSRHRSLRRLSHPHTQQRSRNSGRKHYSRPATDA